MSNTERGDWELPESAEDTAPNKKPVVVLQTGDKPRATRRIKTLLIQASAKPECPASDKIFRRVFDIVHLSRNELSEEDKARGRVSNGPARDDDYHVADDLLIRSADMLWFGDRVEREIEFSKYDRNGDLVAAEPSEENPGTRRRDHYQNGFPAA